MKAIKTKYKGYAFRSRLEARWAVFFDYLNIDWEYEMEGFEFKDGTKYLPDFWLETVNMWAEVKAKEFTKEELKKAQNLAKESNFPVLMLIGTPKRKVYKAIEPGKAGGEYILSNFHNYPKDEGRFYSMPGYIKEVNEEWFNDFGKAVEYAKSATFEFKNFKKEDDSIQKF